MSKVESMNRKMLKGIISSVVEPEEELELVDVGTPMSATELSELSKKAIKDVYKKALLATPTIAAGVPRAGKRAAMGGYADKFAEIERYAVLVTDKAIRVIPVETKSKAFGVLYVARDDLESRTYQRGQVSLDLGEAEESSLYGQKSVTIEVAMSSEGAEPTVLKMGNVEGWRALVVS
jgi:hypothetical protein